MYILTASDTTHIFEQKWIDDVVQFYTVYKDTMEPTQIPDETDIVAMRKNILNILDLEGIGDVMYIF